MSQNQFLTMKKITLRRYNKQNQLSLLLTADTARQDNPELPLELTNQRAETLEWRNQQRITQATLQSPYGQYNSSAGVLYFCLQREVCNNNELIEINQKPYLVELADLRTIPPTFIKSSALIYDIDGKLVSNEHPTIITRGASTFSGIGLRANIETQEYKLLRDVKAMLVPTPDSKISTDQSPH